MTVEHIHKVIDYFAQGARRAREAGLDGVELHSSHGYLFTQFLSSAVNDRKDRVRRQPGESRALPARSDPSDSKGRRQRLSSAGEAQHARLANALSPFRSTGKHAGGIAAGLPVGRSAKESMRFMHRSEISFPHPLMPPGGTPPDEMNWWYGNIMSSGARGYLNYTCFHFKTLRRLIFYFWNRIKKTRPVEGVCLRRSAAK